MIWYMVEHDRVCLLHPHTKNRNRDCFLYHTFSISFLFVRMIIVAWKGHLGYYASGHSDQSSLMSFRISIQCTAVGT